MGPFPPSPGGGEEVSHGFKGKGSLIHLLVDGNGQPIAATTTGANGNERLEVEKLFDKIPTRERWDLARRMTVLEADRGYDSSRLRQALLNRGIFPFIPYRRMGSRDVPSTGDIAKTFNLVQKRWQVERAFAWLKRRCRRLMMRWERRSVIWAGLVTTGLIYMWLNNLLG